jgi:hypothetical protein
MEEKDAAETDCCGGCAGEGEPGRVRWLVHQPLLRVASVGAAPSLTGQQSVVS